MTPTTHRHHDLPRHIIDEGTIMIVKGVIAAGVVSWMATPWIQMTRRGTLDAQTVATWRGEPVGRPRAFPAVELPAQRAAADRARVTS